MIVDELEALAAIFGPENVLSSHGGQHIEIHGLEASVSLEHVTGTKLDASFTVLIKIPDKGYPITAPPILTINAHWLTPVEAKDLANAAITKVWEKDNSQNDLLTSLIFYITANIPTRNIMSTHCWKPQLSPNSKSPNAHNTDEHCEADATLPDRLKPHSVSQTAGGIKIRHGRVLVDRKSSFQAHFSNVSSKLEVHEVLETLLAINKIAKATHNIWAYSIPSETSAKAMDHDSDGESGAGRKMHAMLDLLGASRTFVMVSRWYGGTKLGPDRFRHINTLTAEIIRENSGSG